MDVKTQVIIFDWDDTLLCSSAINAQQWRQDQVREMPYYTILHHIYAAYIIAYNSREIRESSVLEGNGEAKPLRSATLEPFSSCVWRFKASRTWFSICFGHVLMHLGQLEQLESMVESILETAMQLGETVRLPSSLP